MSHIQNLVIVSALVNIIILKKNLTYGYLIGIVSMSTHVATEMAENGFSFCVCVCIGLLQNLSY